MIQITQELEGLHFDDVESMNGENPAAREYNNDLRPLADLVIHTHDQPAPSCILIPPHTGTFHFRPGMIPFLPIFHGMEAFALDQTCLIDVIRLELFQFTLKDKAKVWLLSLKPNSISTWAALSTLFLKKFFPSRRTKELS